MVTLEGYKPSYLREHQGTKVNIAVTSAFRGRLGSLAVRKQADVAALEIKEGDRGVYDVFGGPRKVGRPVMPVPGVRKGQVFEAGWGLRAWGWEPDEA